MCNDEEDLLIGLTPKDMKDNETLAEFKLRVKDSIKTAIPILNTDVDFLEAEVEYFQGVQYDEGFCNE